MLIIGCDYHPGFQQIAYVDSDTGELGEGRLAHREQAEQVYRELQQRNVAVRVGMESSGHSRWFERLLRELQFELWIGDAAVVHTKRVRKRTIDREDARLLLGAMGHAPTARPARRTRPTDAEDPRINSRLNLQTAKKRRGFLDGLRNQAITLIENWAGRPGSMSEIRMLRQLLNDQPEGTRFSSRLSFLSP